MTGQPLRAVGYQVRRFEEELSVGASGPSRYDFNTFQVPARSRELREPGGVKPSRLLFFSVSLDHGDVFRKLGPCTVGTWKVPAARNSFRTPQCLLRRNSWKAGALTRCGPYGCPERLTAPRRSPIAAVASVQGRTTQTRGRRRVDSTRPIPNPGSVSLCNRVGHAVRHHRSFTVDESAQRK
jgi:hypothetical protein